MTFVLIYILSVVDCLLADVITERIHKEFESIKHLEFCGGYDISSKPFQGILLFNLKINFTSSLADKYKKITFTFDRRYPQSPPRVNFACDYHECKEQKCSSNLVMYIFNDNWKKEYKVKDMCLGIIELLDDKEKLILYEAFEPCCVLAKQRTRLAQKDLARQVSVQ